MTCPQNSIIPGNVPRIVALGNSSRKRSSCTLSAFSLRLCPYLSSFFHISLCSSISECTHCLFQGCPISDPASSSLIAPHIWMCSPSLSMPHISACIPYLLRCTLIFECASLFLIVPLHLWPCSPFLTMLPDFLLFPYLWLFPRTNKINSSNNNFFVFHYCFSS